MLRVRVHSWGLPGWVGAPRAPLAWLGPCYPGGPAAGADAFCGDMALVGQCWGQAWRCGAGP